MNDCASNSAKGVAKSIKLEKKPSKQLQYRTVFYSDMTPVSACDVMFVVSFQRHI